MKNYLFRTQGVNNAYYPDQPNSYAFNENAPNCNQLIQDIQQGGITYYLYLIPTGEIIEQGIVTTVNHINNMYYAIYDNRRPFNPTIQSSKWPAPNKGIIPLSVDDLNRILDKNLD